MGWFNRRYQEVQITAEKIAVIIAGETFFSDFRTLAKTCQVLQANTICLPQDRFAHAEAVVVFELELLVGIV